MVLMLSSELRKEVSGRPLGIGIKMPVSTLLSLNWWVNVGGEGWRQVNIQHWNHLAWHNNHISICKGNNIDKNTAGGKKKDQDRVQRIPDENCRTQSEIRSTGLESKDERHGGQEEGLKSDANEISCKEATGTLGRPVLKKWKEWKLILACSVLDPERAPGGTFTTFCTSPCSSKHKNLMN